MTGRLAGTVDGCPVEILGEGATVRLVLPGVLAAWRLRGKLGGASPALRLFSQAGIGLRVTAGFATLPVLPQPHPLVRWFGPELGDR